MKTHQPCHECGSSDALCDYGTHTHCFSCGVHKFADGRTEELPVDGDLIPMELLDIRTLQARGPISRQTCERFGYGYHGDQQVAPYYHEGRLVYQKTRTKDKQFRVRKGSTNVKLNHLLFGRHLWGDSGGKRLIITEGEIDCLTAHEALGSMGFHSVGVSSGVQCALECIKANYEFIDRYAEVYLCFDNDEPGLKGIEQVTKALSCGNLWIFNIPKQYKDLNELFVSGGSRAVIEAYHNANRYKPSGILLSDDIIRMASEEPKFGKSWPWKSLDDSTYGINPHEFVVITAGTGIGKTTLFKTIEEHCFSKHNMKLGLIHLEEPVRDTVNGLLTLRTGVPYHVPNPDVSQEERNKRVREIVGSDRLVLFDKTVGFDEDTLLAAIRYMVVGLGCHAVFLDHITAISDQYDTDVNQRTRNLIVKLGKLVASLPFTLFAISHIRKADGKPAEEGGRVHLDDMLGASALKQWAHYVFGIERNSQAEDELERNCPLLRQLKNRPRGEFTGTVVPLMYDPRTYRLVEKSYGKPLTQTHDDF